MAAKKDKQPDCGEFLIKEHTTTYEVVMSK